jgi:hypothetical protein
MSVGPVDRSTMRGRNPPPIVPEMSTTDDPAAEPEISSDGGERRSLPERTFGAPLVPDCS